VSHVAFGTLSHSRVSMSFTFVLLQHCYAELRFRRTD